jgi:hypothetical protein
MPSSHITDQHTKDALLIVWDILTNLDEDDEQARAKKLDQLRTVLSAIDVPKATARKARAAVDMRVKNPVLPPLDGEDGANAKTGT